jgi:hypothetical protein
MAQQERPTGWSSPRRILRTAACAVAVLAVSAVPWAHALISDSSSVSTSVSTASLAPPSNLAVTYTCTPPPPVVFRGAMSNSGTDAIGLVVPTGVQAGDVMVAQVSNRNGAYGGVTAPSGWTLLGRTSSGSAVTEAVYWKIADAAEPIYYAFYLVGSSGAQMAGGIAAYGGVDRNAPVHAFGTATGAGATASTPSVTTTVPNVVLLHTITKRQEDLPAPGGTTARWQLISGKGTGTAGATAADEPFAGPGSTPVRTSSTGFSTEWVTHTIAVRPVPGTPTAGLTWTGTPSTWATGHRLERMVASSVQATTNVTPRPTTSATDGPLTNGTAYTFSLRAYYRSWTSTPVTAGLTPSC